MAREHLPEVRQGKTLKLVLWAEEGVRVKFFVTVGFYPDGRPGELFLHMDQSGSTLDGFADAWATAVSLALQYGAPWKKIVEKFSFQQFEPSGRSESGELPGGNLARSVVDLTVRALDEALKGGA